MRSRKRRRERKTFVQIKHRCILVQSLSTVKKTNAQQVVKCKGGTAHWIYLCLPSCGPRFESQAHYLRFYYSYQCIEKRTKRPIFKENMLNVGLWLSWQSG